MAKEDNPRWMLSRSQKVLELAAHLRIEELAEQLKAERGEEHEKRGGLGRDGGQLPEGSSENPGKAGNIEETAAGRRGVQRRTGGAGEANLDAEAGREGDGGKGCGH